MKKGMIGAFIGLFSVGFASAAIDTSYISQRVIQIWQDIFTPILSALFGTYYGETYLFTKLMILVLLYVVIRSMLLKAGPLKGNKSVVMVVAGVMSLIAVRYMSELDIVQGVLIPTGVLGVALLTIFPFMLFFFFIQWSEMGSGGRRLSWIIFGIIFLAIWLTRDNLPSLINQIYLWTFVAVVLALIFDRSIHVYFELWEIRKMENTVTDRTVLKLLDDLEQAQRHADVDAGKAAVTRIKKQLRDLKVNISD